MSPPFFPYTQPQWASHALHWLSSDLPALHSLLQVNSESCKKASGLPLGGTVVISGDDELDLLSIAWTWVSPLILPSQLETSRDTQGVYWLSLYPHSNPTRYPINPFRSHFHSSQTIYDVLQSPWWYEAQVKHPVLQLTQALHHPFFSLVIVELDPFMDFSDLQLNFLHHQALLFKTTLVFLHPLPLTVSTLIPRFSFVPHLHLVSHSLRQNHAQNHQDVLSIEIESDFYGRRGSTVL